MDLINTKAEGKEYVMPPPVKEEGKVIDIMSALEKSLERAKQAQGKPAKPAKRKAAARKKAS